MNLNIGTMNRSLANMPSFQPDRVAEPDSTVWIRITPVRKNHPQQ